MNKILYVASLALLLILGISSKVSADTYIVANITEDTVWDASSSPYVVRENIEINAEATLTLDPGVVVKMTDGVGIVVYGSLQAIGSEDQIVSITSYKDDSVGGDSNGNGTSTTPASGDWRGIRFMPGSSGSFDHVSVTYSGYNYRSKLSIPAIYNQGGLITVNNSTLSKSNNCALGQTAGELYVTLSQITDHVFCGIAYYGGVLNMSGNNVESTNYGLFMNGPGTVELSGNEFKDVRIATDINLSEEIDFTHSNNEATGGSFNGFIIRGTIADSTTLVPDLMPYIVTSGGGSTGSGEIKVVTENNLTVGPSGSLLLQPDTVLKFHDSGGIFIDGHLEVDGSTLTSIKDDSVSGDTNGDENGSLPTPGDWLHLSFNSGSTGLIKNSNVRYGGHKFPGFVKGSSLANIFNQGGTVSITQSEISHGHSYGISNTNGITTITHSNIHANSVYGIINGNLAPVVDARNNHWGDPSGPFHSELNVEGLGDRVSDNVLFTPWKGVYCTENCHSNVLFIPGIKGSRLYSGDDKVWEPLGNHNVEKLVMTNTGQSVQNLYTSDIVSKAHNFVDIYDGFARFMVRLTDPEQNDLIADWTPFAYDWRYGVDNIAENGTQYKSEVRDLVDEVKYLAAGSRSDKVIIIGHSNGGLVAKMLINRLEQEGLDHLVDKVVFLASPQIGTPLAIGSILHGYDEEIFGGLIVNDEMAREAIRNMPGGYGLLPSQRYFEEGLGPKVLFDDSVSTVGFRAAYGTSIDSRDELNKFMSGIGDGRAEANTVEEAILANDFMLETSSALHNNFLDTWTAPDGIEIIEIVGVGLDTVSGFRYAEFRERVCTLVIFCENKTFYKPLPLISQYGDQVVMGSSAEGYNGEKETFYLDLKASAAQGGAFEVSHGEITNNPSVQELIVNILTGKTDEVEFISQTKPVFNSGRILLGSHSPVAISALDRNGEQLEVEEHEETGLSFVSKEIPGSDYFELGGSKYIILPSHSDYEFAIQGTGEGGLVLTMDLLDGERQTTVHSISVATVTASTTVDLRYEDGELSNTYVDINGDGVIDQEITPDGDIVTEGATYQKLYEAVIALPLKNKVTKPLTALVAVAEKFNGRVFKNEKFIKLEILALDQLNKALKLYVRINLLDQKNIDPVILIIDKLKSRYE